MFCKNCGNQLPDTAQFCNRCGWRVENAQPTVSAQRPPVSPQQPGANAPQYAAAKKKKKFPILAVIIPLVVIVLGVGGFFGWRALSAAKEYRELIAEADGYYSEQDYERAASRYARAMREKPNDTDTGLLLADCYLHLEEYDKAASALQDLKISENDERYETYERLQRIAEFSPEFESIDTDGWPEVRVHLRAGGGALPAVTVTENGVPRDAAAEAAGDGLDVVFGSEAPEYYSESHEVAMELDMEGYPFHIGFRYDTPYFEQAQLKFVSADVSEYPTVKLYFRVSDAFEGTTVTGLQAKNFVVYERIEGGSYLAREVTGASQLEGRQGLNISLAADKSGSIDYSDMQKIQNVMIDFVGSLNYTVGDTAEVLSFDSIVQQMCSFTSDQTLLVNGIRNMSPDGMTALYDAIYMGVRHAALQGGARCVVAFTDGYDNVSHHNVQEVIQYANDNQVPVYIVGVGYWLAEDVLRSIAESTGGRYWFIDDLYDMESILQDVYAEQQELYVIEYVSEAGAALDAERGVQVSFSGAGYKGETEHTFEAVEAVHSTHTSRYEVYKECLTWEQARQRCEEMGGHLVTITSKAEQDDVIALAEAAGVQYIWLGGYTSYDRYGNVFGHWITGEEFTFADWNANEPSRHDLDGTDEWYIMLWYLERFGGWHWNDQRNDPAPVNPPLRDGMGFICEYED